MRDVCSVTDDACTVQQELVKRRSSLLLKYIRKDTAKFELEALYAVQLIVHRHGHPYGLYTHCTLVLHRHGHPYGLYTHCTHIVHRHGHPYGLYTHRDATKCELEALYAGQLIYTDTDILMACTHT